MRRFGRCGFSIALAVSLAFHAALLAWTLAFSPPPRVREAPAPIRLELVTPERDLAAQSPADRVAPTVAAPERGQSRPPSQSERRPGGGKATGEPGAAPPAVRDDDAKRRIDLFDPHAIAEGARRRDPIAPAPEPEPPANPVQALLDAATFGRRHAPRTTSALVALGIQLGSWFDPPAETVRRSGVTERRRIAERLRNYLAHPPREKLEIDEEYLDPPDRGESGFGRAGLSCLSGCADSHVQAKLLVLIEIDHSRVPPRASVLVSSGYADYDRAARSAVEDYVRHRATELPIDAEATHWTFESEVYRYRRDDLILDPQFEPPGRRIDEGVLFVYSLDTTIRMVAVAR